MDTKLHTQIVAGVISRFSKDGQAREEALRDLLLLREENPERAEDLAKIIPALPAALHCKWATIFADRLLETASKEQVEELCQMNDHSSAALAMVFLLFLESGRMERQMDADIKEWHTGGTVSTNYVEKNWV